MFDFKVFKLKSYNSFTLNFSFKKKLLKGQFKIKPAKNSNLDFSIQSDLVTKSEPIGFRTDLIINQLKIFFKQVCGPILKLLKHPNMVIKVHLSLYGTPCHYI